MAEVTYSINGSPTKELAVAATTYDGNVANRHINLTTFRPHRFCCPASILAHTSMQDIYKFNLAIAIVIVKRQVNVIFNQIKCVLAQKIEIVTTRSCLSSSISTHVLRQCDRSHDVELWGEESVAASFEILIYTTQVTVFVIAKVLRRAAAIEKLLERLFRVADGEGAVTIGCQNNQCTRRS